MVSPGRQCTNVQVESVEVVKTWDGYNLLGNKQGRRQKIGMLRTRENGLIRKCGGKISQDDAYLRAMRVETMILQSNPKKVEVMQT